MPVITKTPAAYDPCYCGSGVKYKFCHYLLDIASANTKCELSQKMYIDRWNKNAVHFRDQGCYTWMASQLAPHSPKLILDVGCGDGSGLLAIKNVCKSNPRILSCDDNINCLKMAHDKIAACGLDVKLVQRLRQIAAGENYHEMEADTDKLHIPVEYADITLVEADIIWDSEFSDFLKSWPKFDAITVWLVGTYDLKPECRNLKKPVGGQLYRLTVQNNVYQLADKILRVGGVLQIVDRGESPKEDFLKQDTIQSHQEQAQGTSMEFLDLQSKDYDEPAQGAGITMVKAIGKSGRIPDLTQLAMSSIIFIKCK